jgi:hypothetical protein
MPLVGERLFAHGDALIVRRRIGLLWMYQTVR